MLKNIWQHCAVLPKVLIMFLEDATVLQFQ